MRLLAGALAGRPLRAVLSGDPQLLRRPMERVAAPLRRMGARIETSAGTPPVTLDGGALRGARHRLPVASAQVKSAILLAGLRAEGETAVTEPHPSRDHTERLLAWLGAPIRRDDPRTVRVGPAALKGLTLRVPGDVSSAAFLAAAGALVPGSDIAVEDVGLNPTRTGFLRALARMGAEVETEVLEEEPEPRGRLRVRPCPLTGIEVGAGDVPGIVDELPLLGLVATAAEGETRVTGAGELRVKESDRIAGLVAGLRALGARAEELPDGFVVEGPTRLGGGAADARGDHRLAMTFAVAGLVAAGPVHVTGMGRAADSFPGFLRTLEDLR
jgi:3-phosphoshikimate 1-carboxyvinyltransferase